MTTQVNVIENFFTEDECDEILQRHTSKLTKADTLSGYMPTYRNAKYGWINDIQSDTLVLKYQKKIEELTGISSNHYEYPHVVEYDIGGQYKKHHDFFHPGTDYYHRCMAEGGQRTHTCILYLNDDFTGGETKFYDLNLKVKPKKGSLCYWRNIDESGEINYDSLHAGLPVTSGKKYILISWIRQKNFDNHVN